MSDGDIGYLLNRATRRLRLDFAARLSGLGLRPQQAAVLLAIARSDGGRLTPSRIAELTDADAATTSGVLDRLARDGWVLAHPNPEDGRSRLIALTETAVAALPAVVAAAQDSSRDATSALSPDERELLRGLLERIAADEPRGGA